MLHFESLKDLTLSLENKNLDSCLIKFSSASPGILVFCESIENVLYLKYATFSVDLFNKTLLVELDSHHLQCSGLNQTLVLFLNEIADSSDAVTFLGSLEPVVHYGCKIDIISQLAFTII